MAIVLIEQEISELTPLDLGHVEALDRGGVYGRRSKLWTLNGVGLGAGHDITQWMVNVFWSVLCSSLLF